jgi:putative pyoverdin transport system ATP-binding/permease protein
MEKELDRLDKEETDSEPKDRYEANIKSFEEINYNKLIFDYTNKNGTSGFRLGPIDLTVKKDEILFITGGNGSGKSTLLKLITGLYFPLSGSIEINGKEAGKEELRSLFSPIFIDPHIFDRLYGLDYIDSEKVNQMLEQMELNKKTRFEENRFTELDLSTGQRKRLALIAALLEDRPIYIFDEWAAEQDPHFRKYFYETLLPSLKAQNKAIIAVTHDDHYFHAADRIVKLDYGEIKSY